jgi:hypothetical protein
MAWNPSHPRLSAGNGSAAAYFWRSFRANQAGRGSNPSPPGTCDRFFRDIGRKYVPDLVNGGQNGLYWRLFGKTEVSDRELPPTANRGFTRPPRHALARQMIVSGRPERMIEMKPEGTKKILPAADVVPPPPTPHPFRSNRYRLSSSCAFSTHARTVAL